MFLLHESIWWLMAAGAVGFYMGYLKGMARWGLLLGMMFGPIGWGILLLLPARRPAQAAGGPSRPAGTGNRAIGPACPRCGKTVGNRDKACGHCGNVLMAVRYKVIASTPLKG